MEVDTKTLVFEEIAPRGPWKKPVDTVRLSKGKLSLGRLAYEALGQPGSLKIEIDVSKHALRLTNQGPFSVTKSRSVSSTDLERLEDGLYEPIGGGLYLWAVRS